MIETTSPEPEGAIAHELKTIQPWFDEVMFGKKTFEVRRDDRGFAVGDVLLLREWSEVEGYSGRSVTAEVTGIVRGGDDSIGVVPGFVVMSIRRTRVLVIVDEVAGISEEIYDSVSSTHLRENEIVQIPYEPRGFGAGRPENREGRRLSLGDIWGRKIGKIR